MRVHRQGRLSRRRQMVLGVALGVASMGLTAFADDAPPKSPKPSANASRTSLHQELRFKASPERLYEILLSSQQFTAFSGAPATIDPLVGGAFSLFGGMIVGRNVELVPNQRIVQAWRPANWPPGVYSLVRIELKPEGAQTLLVLDHSGFPAGGVDHLSTGWTEHYWQPLTKFLASATAGAPPSNSPR
jgi:activator of HSP90 ATPase